MSRQQITVNVSFTRAQRKAVAEFLPKVADRLKLDEPKSRAIPFSVAELREVQQAAREAVPRAEHGMQRNSLRHVVEKTEEAIEKSKGIEAIPASERVYQFKVTLFDSEPPIWRRIQVKDCTLDRLHERIQTAMGWTNSHLHQFSIDGDRYGDLELLDDGFDDLPCIDSTVTRIGEIVPKDGRRFRFLYEYDFGDCWIHEVLFEGCLRARKRERYPLCVEGERACPPEDVGGAWGYAEFLEVIADPSREGHDACVDWAGRFHPEEFDAEKATKRMRRGLPDWRTMW